MGIVRELSPELDPVEFPDDMGPEQVEAYVAEKGDELRRRLIARKQASMATETEGEEALKYAMGEVPLSERVGSTILNLPQTAMRQMGGTLRGLGAYLAEAPIPRERGEVGTGVVQENLRRQQRTRQQVAEEIEQSAIREAGAEMQEAAPDIFPTLPGVRESLPSQVAGGLGSIAALAPAMVSGPAAPFVGGTMYGLSAGEDFADDARRVVNDRIAEALANGDYDTAADLERRKFDMEDKARQAGRVIGFGAEAALGAAAKLRVGKSSIGGIGEKLAERLVAKSAPQAVQRAVRGAVEGGATEAAQEATEQALGNAAALAVYDPDRSIMEDLGQAALVGGLTGGVAGGARGSGPRNPLPRSTAAAVGKRVAQEIPQDVGDIAAPDITEADVEDVFAGVDTPAETVAAEEAVPTSEPQPAQVETPVARDVEAEKVIEELEKLDDEEMLAASLMLPEEMSDRVLKITRERNNKAIREMNAKREANAENPFRPDVSLAPVETPAATAPVEPPPQLTPEVSAPKKPRRKPKPNAIEATITATPTPEPATPPQAEAPRVTIPPDDAAMEAATAAAVAPGQPAPVAKAPEEGIAERVAADLAMEQATARTPQTPAAPVTAPEAGIAERVAADTEMERATAMAGQTPVEAALNVAPEEGFAQIDRSAPADKTGFAQIDRSGKKPAKGRKAKPITPAPAAEPIPPAERLRRLQSVENKANKRGYEPLTEKEVAELVESGDVEGKGKRKGRLTEQGRRAFNELSQQARREMLAEGDRLDAEQEAKFVEERQREIDKQQKEDEAEFAKAGKLTNQQRVDMAELREVEKQRGKLGTLNNARLRWLESKESKSDRLERALDSKEDRMAQPIDSDQSSEPLSDELISKFTETDGYGFTEVKPELLLEQISSGQIKLKPVRAALLAHLLKPDSRHKLKEIELVKSTEFSGRFNTRRNSNVGTIQISTVYKDGSPVSVNHFAHALTHELVHNAVTSKLDESPQFKARAKSLYDYVKEKTPGTKWANSYAMSNLSEFFAEGMANSGFRKFLLGIEYPITMRQPGMPSTGRLSAFGGMLYLLKQALNLPKFIYDKFTGQQVESITALDELVDVAQRLESQRRAGEQAMMGFMEASDPGAIQRALDAAIKATDPGGSYSDPLGGAVALSVLNAALRLARRVYLRTRNLVRAKQQGMRLIRRRQRTIPPADLPKIEEAFSNLVDNGITEGPPPQTVTPASPLPGGPRRASRGLFKGDVTIDSDAQWQAQADEWIAQFNGNLRRAFESARSTDFQTTGLNQSAQYYVFGKLLELSEIAANAARNDVDMLRHLNLQKEITDAMKFDAAEAGKTLAATNLVKNRIMWMFPVLTYRNLIREEQKRLPFPDVVADEVRTWLSESGRRAVQEMRNAMTDADKVFARELKSTVRDMRVVWRDVMTASVESQENMRRKILEELVKAPELQGLSRQGYIDIANLLGKAWEKERARIFQAEFRKQVPLPSVKEDDRRKLFTAIPNILKWANLGLLDNEAFRNAIAPQYGVAKFDGDTAKKLNTMAQEAQKVGGSNRNRLIMDMYNLMQQEGGVRAADVFRDYWYAAVLSGIRTQVDNAMNILTGALTSAMGITMAKSEARGAIAKAYGKGLAEAVHDFWPILWRGELWRNVNFNPNQPANTLEAISKSGNVFARALGQFKYVGRLMNALDHVNALSSEQAMMAWALSRRLPIEHLHRYMTPSETVLRQARARAEAEGTTPDLMNKRVREIVQESIPVEILISARDLRQLVTFTNQPKGVMGGLYRGIQEMEKAAPGFKMLSGTQFVRFAGNYTNEILNYVAPVALYRYYMSAPSRQGGRGGLKMGEEERQLILAKLALGSALGVMAGALFLGDDDEEKDRKIDITGSFKSLDSKKKNQLLDEGRQPYSIRFGNTYVSYRQLPFGGVLGAIGELRDRQLFNRKEWDQESLARKVADAGMAGAFIVRDSSAISGLTEFLGMANAHKYDMDDVAERSMPKYLAKIAGSVVPNITKEIDAWADPSIFRANTGFEYFLQQVPYLRREVGAGPFLNVLGEPARVERYPYSRWVRTRQEDKAWSTLGTLASRGVFLSVPSANVKVLENGKRRPMTPQEQHAYQKRVGAGYRKFVEDNSEKLLRMKPDEAAKFIKDETERIRRRND